MSSETKFTGSDWHRHSYHGSKESPRIQTICYGINKHGDGPKGDVCTITTGNPADADLIIAAPDMYEALEVALKLMEDNEVENDAYWSDGKSIDEIEKAGLLPIEILQARKALAKARGEH